VGAAATGWVAIVEDTKLVQPQFSAKKRPVFYGKLRLYEFPGANSSVRVNGSAGFCINCAAVTFVV
jgi:hypothetical protein